MVARRYRSPPLGDRERLRAAPIERAQRRQAADDVEEVDGEPAQGVGSLLGAPGGVAAHQDHEDRHQRERHDHDRGGDGVDRDDPGDDRDRHERCEHELGQEPPEVGLERRGSEDRGGGELGALGAVERRRPVDEPALGEREPKLREDARCREPPDGLEGPCEPGPRGEDEERAARAAASAPRGSSPRTSPRSRARAASPARSPARRPRGRSPHPGRAGGAPAVRARGVEDRAGPAAGRLSYPPGRPRGSRGLSSPTRPRLPR